MGDSKYIVILIAGLETAVIFGAHVQHKHMAQMLCGAEYEDRVLSAGFVSVGMGADNEVNVSAYGHSTSLKKASRELDDFLLKQALGAVYL